MLVWFKGFMKSLLLAAFLTGCTPLYIAVNDEEKCLPPEPILMDMMGGTMITFYGVANVSPLPIMLGTGMLALSTALFIEQAACGIH